MSPDLADLIPSTIDLGVLPSELDEGIASRAAIGLVVLATDHTMEHEFRALLRLPGVAVYKSRVFNDADGKMNLGVQDVGGAVLVVSQFTLYGDCRKGRRPSFVGAAGPDVAVPLYEAFVNAVRARGVPVQTGRFGAMMQVELTNDGPVTLIVDTP